MKTLVVTLLTMVLAWLAYYAHVFHATFVPPKDVAAMLQDGCAFDSAQSVTVRTDAHPHALTSCQVALQMPPESLTFAEATVAEGRPFLLESVVVCKYSPIPGSTQQVQCRSYTNGP